MPDFQFGDVVRLRALYLYDDEDIDKMYRLFIIGETRGIGRETTKAIVLVSGASGEEIEGVGTLKIINTDMYELDPNFAQGKGEVYEAR